MCLDTDQKTRRDASLDKSHVCECVCSSQQTEPLEMNFIWSSKIYVVDT